MLPQGHERRGTPRYRIPIPVTFQIIYPEETFSVKEHRGVAADVSLTGCRLRINSIDRGEYEKILASTRYAKLWFEVRPGIKLEARAQLVWVQHSTAASGELEHCILGILFTQLSDEFKKSLETLMENHIGGGGVPLK